MKKFAIATAVAAMTLTSANAFAASGNVPFNGTVNATCTVTVGGTPGALGANTGFTQLGSTAAFGGTAATATVFSNAGSYGIGVTAPADFDAGSAGVGGGSTFLASYNATGANTVSGDSTEANKPLANAGTTNVSVDLVATSSGAPYGPGTYAATVVLRCE